MSATVTKPTLTYFNVFARAEVPRLMLEDAGVDYDYVAVDYASNWGETKAKLIAEGKLPFGQVPLYEEPGGLALVQSAAIARYVAKKHGYAGTSALEEALIDQAAEGANDTYVALATAFYGSAPDQRDAAVGKVVKETLPGHLASFNKLLEKNGNQGFLVGSKLSYADLALYRAVHMIPKADDGGDVLDSYPAVKKLVTAVSERERIKAYLARDVYAKPN
jgi:glutathione S-transferase